MRPFLGETMEYIVIAGRQIPVYGLLGVSGVVLGIVCLFFICRYLKKSFFDYIYILIWACIFAMLGAKVLYLIIEGRKMIEIISSHKYATGDVIMAYIKGGFVFYGGLFGAIGGTRLSTRFFGMSFTEAVNVCIPIMPLAHGFGRIGCHLVGCCYGMNYDGFLAVHYTASHCAPNNTGLFPVQLIESVFDFVLFTVLIVLIVRKRHLNHLIDIYLWAYSIARFILEFFRGDTRRGIFGGLSTSQWIGICIWCGLLIIYFVRRKGKSASPEIVESALPRK